MIKFDSDKLHIRHVLLKSATTALGGSINIENGNNIEKIPVPMAITRAFIKKHKVSKYLIPVWTALVYYEDVVVAMERHSLGGLGTNLQENLDGTISVWKSTSEKMIDDCLIPMTDTGDWFFDGRYVYKMDQASKTIDEIVQTAPSLTHDKMFRNIVVQAIDMQRLETQDQLELQPRNCLAFVVSPTTYSISPPIWKDLSSVGDSDRTGFVGDEDSDERDDAVRDNMVGNVLAFDTIDTQMSVNLNFALKAGRELGKMFGYESIEPLKLADLMVELHTVNLPELPKQVKSTYDIHIQFTHAMAWLLGLMKRTTDLHSYITMRSLIKYLTHKGIFKKTTMNSNNIFKTGKSISDITTIAA